jgi:hypothetical protein
MLEITMHVPEEGDDEENMKITSDRDEPLTAGDALPPLQAAIDSIQSEMAETEVE